MFKFVYPILYISRTKLILQGKWPLIFFSYDKGFPKIWVLNPKNKFEISTVSPIETAVSLFYFPKVVLQKLNFHNIF